MTFSQVAVQFPRIAGELARLSGADLDQAVQRIVEGALAAADVPVASRDSKAVERLVWSLEDSASKMQEEADQGAASQIAYHRAFRKAMAANGLLDLVEGRYGPAVSNATYALNSDEDAVLQLLVGPPG